MNERLQALNRFGLGARIGEAAQLTEPRAWLRAQLVPDAARLPANGLFSLDELFEALRRQRTAGQSGDQDERRAAASRARELVGREASTAMTRRVSSDAPFVERLVAFWSNHLCVAAQANPGVALLAGHYERTVIRPHVLGRFEDMLLASARHPAMLLYLDNARSIGPNSAGARAARRRGRERGLNENYARELLELHTVGVDGGYTEEDVEQLALVLTGWTVAGVAGPPAGRGREQATPSAAPGFQFQEQLHEPGAKVVLGTRYGDAGEQQGEQVIRDLARHPSTARHLATKLARHFVADEPPQSAVDQLALVFLDSEGDLREVALALVELDAPWLGDGRKFRTPQDWLVAVLRATDAREVSPVLVDVLRALRQPLWAPPAPKGYDDVARVWADPDSLMNRAEVARSLSRRVGRVVLDPPQLLDVISPDDGGALETMLRDRTIAPDERLALAVASPAFQWR